MTELTPRQIDLLKLIIKEYSHSGEPVGSELLEKKYHVGVSPATIRNEMVELTRHGYLKKSYFSAGRIPTSKAFRFYIKYLMEEKEMSTAEEVSAKSDIWDFKGELNRLMLHATQTLAHKTRLLAAASTNNGDIFIFGVNYILENKEFQDMERTRQLFHKCEGAGFWANILTQFSAIDDNLLFLFDEEPESDEVASVFGEFGSGDIKGTIGVIGPRRMRYETIVPHIRYFTSLIEEIIK
ncbi:MAG: hypothetical protein ACMG6E_06725 [Candidatus Roizmanbacteria bacterium]